MILFVAGKLTVSGWNMPHTAERDVVMSEE